MPPRDAADQAMISESGNWNVAAKFSEKKIMEAMNKCEYFKDVAEFGFQSLTEQLINYNISSDLIKKVAMERWISELIKITKNAEFAMKQQTSKKDLGRCNKKLKIVRDSILPTLYKLNRSDVNKTKQILLDGPRYKIVFESILDIEAEINVPLNKNDLIFTHKDDFDPAAFKARIKDRIVNRG